MKYIVKFDDYWLAGEYKDFSIYTWLEARQENAKRFQNISDAKWYASRQNGHYEIIEVHE